MRLKPDASESGIAKDNLILRCADCLHYDATRSPIYDTVCKTRGVLKNAAAPNCFTPNISTFRTLGPEFYHVLAVLTSTLKPSAVRVLAGILKTSPSLSRRGFHLFERVYFTVGSGRYLSNYFSGFVIAPGATTRSVIVAGSLKRSVKVVTAILEASSLMKYEDFVPIRDKLIASGKIIDPDSVTVKFKPKILKSAEYEPPTLDMFNSGTAADKTDVRERIKKLNAKGGTQIILDDTPRKRFASDVPFKRGMGGKRGKSKAAR